MFRGLRVRLAHKASAGHRESKAYKVSAGHRESAGLREILEKEDHKDLKENRASKVFKD